MTEGRQPGPDHPPPHLRLSILISLMVLFWSLNYIIGKVALREFPPLLLAGLRTTLAGLFLAPIYVWEVGRAGNRGGCDSRHTRMRADLPTLLFLALSGMALNQLFFAVGLSRTSVAHSSILIGMTPILVLLIAVLSRQERLTAAKILGMAVALGGVAVLNLSPSKGSGATLLGDFYTFLAALTFALFTVVGKEFSRRYSSVTVNAFGYVSGALMLCPITLWQAAHFSFAHLSLHAWASLVYMALFPSVVCYLIFYYALTHIAASRISAFSYLQPPIATLIAVFALGEPVTSGLVAGGILVLLGVYVTEHP